MRNFWLFVVIGLIFSGCSEQGFSGDKEIPNPLFDAEPLGSQQIMDKYIQPEPQYMDILWVIDNSCSMSDQQAKLIENYPIFMDYIVESYVDYHIGVTTTDTENEAWYKGRLNSFYEADLGGNINEHMWISSDTIDPYLSFSSAAAVGTAGSPIERGIEATYYAINHEANIGFFRPGVPLHIIVISDEEDQSKYNPKEFVEYLRGLYIEVNFSFSGIIGLEDVSNGGGGTIYGQPGCYAYGGARYLEVINHTNGLSHSICKDDWVEILDALGRKFRAPPQIFYLTSIPEFGTIEVQVISDDEITFVFYENEDWVYDQVTNSIEFLSYIPQENYEIRIIYVDQSTLDKGF